MKSKTIYLLTLITVLLISGCSTINTYQNSLYDNNEKLAKDGDSYTFKDRIGSLEDSVFSLSFTGFSGKQTVKEIEATTQGTVELEITIKTTSGKFKICLINADKEVSIIVEGRIDEKFIITLKEGKNAIVIVGKNASGEVSIRFDE